MKTKDEIIRKWLSDNEAPYLRAFRAYIDPNVGGLKECFKEVLYKGEDIVPEILKVEAKGSSRFYSEIATDFLDTHFTSPCSVITYKGTPISTDYEFLGIVKDYVIKTGKIGCVIEPN